MNDFEVIAHFRAVEVAFASDPTVPEDYLERQRARQVLLDLLEAARKRRLAQLITGDNLKE